MDVLTAKAYAGKKILIVEDDDYFRDALGTFLQGRGFSVTAAPNGKVARDICGLQEFDLILSDVQMPYLDGVELLKWIKANRPTPFVLMTGFSNLLEAQTAFDLGASEFIPKPFKNAELFAIIDHVVFPEKPKLDPVSQNTDQYCKVSIEEFVAKPRIDFDVYVKLSEQKMVKIGHAGGEIPIDRIQMYKEKGLKHLFIRQEDFKKLVNFNIAVSRVLAQNDAVSSEKKLNFMRYTSEVILEKAFVQGVDTELYSDAKDVLGATISVVSENSEQVDLLDVLNSHSDWIYAHSIAAGMFAMMIARKMGHTSSQTFFKLGMCGLFHEVGYKEIPRAIVDKPRPLLTQSERSLIETHVARSKEILAFIKGVPNDVTDIIYQHHEDNLGQGFPRRLGKNEIHPLAKIFIVADLFADIAVKGPQYSGLTGLAAAKHVETHWGDRVDKEVLAALRSIFYKA